MLKGKSEIGKQVIRSLLHELNLIFSIVKDANLHTHFMCVLAIKHKKRFLSSLIKKIIYESVDMCHIRPIHFMIDGERVGLREVTGMSVRVN